MVPMSKDANGDGFIDGDGGVPVSGALSMQPSTTMTGAGNGIAQPHERLIGGSLSWYLDDAGYPVRLDACASTGSTYTWTIDDRPPTPKKPLGKRTCRSTVLLPEGVHRLTLQVHGKGTTSTTSVDADVHNILMVTLGDSYAAGTGNPRNVTAWLRKGGPFTPFRPYFDDAGCTRSVRGAPAQAALALEKASPKTSVTLVDVACGGATIDAGILGPQPASGQSASQIEQVRRIIGTRAIDLVLLSIGGNDVGFTQLLMACATDVDCPNSPSSAVPFRGSPTIQDAVQSLTGALPASFARIAACLGGTGCSLRGPGVDTALPMAPGARVLPMLYPDITRAADGSSCAYFTLTPENMAWARDTMLVPNPGADYTYRGRTGAQTFPLPNGTLNATLAATTSLGWRPVLDTWAASGDSPVGHGVCAGPQAWAFGETATAGFGSASFHPNPIGQSMTARALFAAASRP